MTEDAFWPEDMEHDRRKEAGEPHRLTVQRKDITVIDESRLPIDRFGGRLPEDDRRGK